MGITHASVVIEIHYLIESPESTIVHVGCRPSDFSKRRRLEASAVLVLLRDLHSSFLRQAGLGAVGPEEAEARLPGKTLRGAFAAALLELAQVVDARPPRRSARPSRIRISFFGEEFGFRHRRAAARADADAATPRAVVGRVSAQVDVLLT